MLGVGGSGADACRFYTSSRSDIPLSIANEAAERRRCKSFSHTPAAVTSGVHNRRNAVSCEAANPATGRLEGAASPPSPTGGVRQLVNCASSLGTGTPIANVHKERIDASRPGLPIEALGARQGSGRGPRLTPYSLPTPPHRCHRGAALQFGVLRHRQIDPALLLGKLLRLPELCQAFAQGA